MRAVLEKEPRSLSYRGLRISKPFRVGLRIVKFEQCESLIHCSGEQRTDRGVDPRRGQHDRRPLIGGEMFEACHGPPSSPVTKRSQTVFLEVSYKAVYKLVAIIAHLKLRSTAINTPDLSENLVMRNRTALTSLPIILVTLTTSPSAQGDDPADVAPGYDIPLIDLAGQSDRQVVVDREQGQYLGHPTTVLLEDGQTMIIVYPKGHGRGPIVMKRSEDGGRSWSDRLPVPENWATSQETPTIHRVIDSEGTKRLILFSGLYPIRMAVSEDDGQNWTPLEPIGDFGGIVAMSSVERLNDGSYMALFHDDGRFLRGDGERKSFQVFKTLSTDGGLTWSEPEVIAEHPTAHLCEPGLIRSPDGSQIAVLLRENSRTMNSFLILSDDEGATWSEPRELPGALTGDRHVGKYAPDGRLFISFRDTTRESPTQGDWVGWVGTYDDLVEGRQGQYRVRLMKNYRAADCAYPGVEILPDGTFVTTTYGHWSEGEAPYIVSVRFSLDELDAMND